MQLKSLAVLVSSTLWILQGCKVSTQLPLEAVDLRLCGGAVKVVDVVKRVSANHRLNFHHGTHVADFGTQVTFRLVGEGFEIEMFNSMDESDYTLRVYETPPNHGASGRARNTYSRFKASLLSARSVNCPV
jgi:hypothetical protein